MGGMIARLRVPLESKRGAIVAPERAVFSENGGDYAFVAAAVGAQGGYKATKRLLKLGEADGESVEILEGLAPGDLVVSEGKEFIAEGDAIAVSR